MIKIKRFIPLIVVGVVFGLGAFGYLTIEHYGLETLISVIGVAGIAAIIFAESGLLVGFFLPGDSLIFTAGFLVHAGIIQFNIHLLALILFIAAVAGDNVGYAFGKRFGRKLFKRKESVLFRQENLHRAENFYKDHGPVTIILARFIPVIRTFAPIVAGISHMNYRTFFTFNVIGGLVWAVGFTYLGYFAGTFIERYGINVEYVILAIIFLSILPPFIHVFKDKANRQALYNEVTRYINHLRGK